MNRSDEAVAFPRLESGQIDELRELGREEEAPEGRILFSEGDRGFDFYVVLSGSVEIVEHSGDEPARVTVHEPGEFTGDVDMLSGRSALVTARVLEPGRVLALDARSIKEVVAEIPGLGDLILRAFLMRRVLLLAGDFAGLRIIGSRFSRDTHRLRDFASRNAIPFTWVDLEEDEAADTLLSRFDVEPSETPVVIGRGDWILRNPSNGELARAMGLDSEAVPRELHDLVVVGAGPAGLAAAVYGASEGLQTLVVDAVATGGQAATSSRIENYLGFPTGLSGQELAERAVIQARKFGARIAVPRSAVGLACHDTFKVVTLDDGTEIRGRAVVLATGADYRRLQVPGLERFEGASVFYSATATEARLCAEREVVVVGGGNSAGQAASYLAAHARAVHLCIRGDDLGKSMSRYLVDRIERDPDIQVRRHTEVARLAGDETLERVVVVDNRSGEEEELDAPALFVFIGAEPRTRWLGDEVAADSDGFVLTGGALPPEARQGRAWAAADRDPFLLETSVPGIFATGDVRSGSIKRVASAVGEGSTAVKFVHEFLARS